MKAAWTGIIFCFVVIYFGIIHSASNPLVLLNAHALILVIGGTIGIAFLTYSSNRLLEVIDFILFGFLFRMKRNDCDLARDLISRLDTFYARPVSFELSSKPHPFLREAFELLNRAQVQPQHLEAILFDRRNSVRRKYMEDAKILNNISKYPPHLGLLGAASGMIEMMGGLGSGGVDGIGASMAVALSATLWGVGLNNFVFLPLSDNSMKAAEDEINQRNMVIDCILLAKKQMPYEWVIQVCLNKLSMQERAQVTAQYELKQKEFQSSNAA